MLIMYHMNVV